MAPKGGKPKAKAAVKKDSVDIPAAAANSLDAVLAKWDDAKKRESAAHKECEACKTQGEAAMMKLGEDNVKTDHYEVNRRKQSRESLGKADCPADIWSQYAKTSEFTVTSFKDLKKK